MTARDVEKQILAFVESSIEDTRVPDAIAAHADKRAGKPVTKTDAEQLSVQLFEHVGRNDVRIRRQYGMTHVSWGPYNHEHSILLAHSESNVRWPSAAELREKNPAYFHARDERNADRKKLLQEQATMRSVYGNGETPDPDAESTIYRAARAVVKLREAREELEKLIEYGEPLNVVRYAVEKLAKEE